MKDFWDNRYAEKVYAYGKEPNRYFKESLERYEIIGNILLPAEGEGRNAVFAANKGLEVTAFDISQEGRKKALELADEHDVSLRYTLGSLDEQEFERGQFDAIGLIFAHFPPDKLSEYHQELVKLLKRGGLIILEGFSKNHLAHQEVNPHAGGPKNVDMLFSVEMIQTDFVGLEVLELEEKEVMLNEGPFHQGRSSVVRFVGRKIH